MEDFLLKCPGRVRKAYWEIYNAVVKILKVYLEKMLKEFLGKYTKQCYRNSWKIYVSLCARATEEFLIGSLDGSLRSNSLRHSWGYFQWNPWRNFWGNFWRGSWRNACTNSKIFSENKLLTETILKKKTSECGNDYWAF